MKLIILIAIPFLLLSGTPMRAQTRFAKDNAEIVAVVSSGEVSRIALYDDRIRSVMSVPAGFSLAHDGAIGDVFLIPEDFGVLAEGFINLFIISEAGYTYQLLLQLRDIPSEQIRIRNPSAKSLDAPRHCPCEPCHFGIMVQRTKRIKARRGGCAFEPAALQCVLDRNQRITLPVFLIVLILPAGADACGFVGAIRLVDHVISEDV